MARRWSPMRRNTKAFSSKESPRKSSAVDEQSGYNLHIFSFNPVIVPQRKVEEVPDVLPCIDPLLLMPPDHSFDELLPQCPLPNERRTENALLCESPPILPKPFADGSGKALLSTIDDVLRYDAFHSLLEDVFCLAVFDLELRPVGLALEVEAEGHRKSRRRSRWRQEPGCRRTRRY